MLTSLWRSSGEYHITISGKLKTLKDRLTFRKKISAKISDCNYRNDHHVGRLVRNSYLGEKIGRHIV